MFIGIPTQANVLEITSPDADFNISKKNIPPLDESQVLIKVHAVPIKPFDKIIISGKFEGLSYPLIPGTECSGIIVDAVGNKHKDLIGRKVAALGLEGTMRDYFKAHLRDCMILDDDFDLDLAACGFGNAVCAYALVDIAMKHGAECVINTAASSSVGKNIIRLCKKRGIKTINIIEKDQRIPALKEMGADYILNQHDPDFKQYLANVSHTLGATVGFDAIGGEMSRILIRSMGESCWVVNYGFLSGKIDLMLNSPDLHSGKKFTEMNAAVWLMERKDPEREKIFTYIHDNFMEVFKPEIETILGWKDYKVGYELYRNWLDGKKVLISPTF